MNAITEAIASINGMTAYTLANMADVSCPDSPDSYGATFLSGVRDSVVEQLDYYTGGDYSVFEEPSELVDAVRELEPFTEIPDGAPSIYTHERFQQLVDLCAYREDVSELATDVTDMEQLAGIALYMVAERLVSALLDYVADSEASETVEP